MLISPISADQGSSLRIYSQQCVGAMACGHLIQHSTTAQVSIYNVHEDLLSFYMIGFLVDCGQPEFPSNGVISNVSSTTEGANVTFQCEEGLLPSDSITLSTCNSTGQWTPSPADVQCLLAQGISIFGNCCTLVTLY